MVSWFSCLLLAKIPVLYIHIINSMESKVMVRCHNAKPKSDLTFCTSPALEQVKHATYFTVP